MLIFETASIAHLGALGSNEKSHDPDWHAMGVSEVSVWAEAVHTQGRCMTAGLQQRRTWE